MRNYCILLLLVFVVYGHSVPKIVLVNDKNEYFDTNYNKAKKKTDCQVFQTLINAQELLNTTEQVLPQYIHLRQCIGGCNLSGTKCTPTKTKKVPYPVKICGKNYYTHLEEHVSCSCQCAVMAHHCNENQFYDTSRCRCECRNEDYCTDDMDWDPTDCSCKCAKTEECSTGSVWNVEHCSCVEPKRMSDGTMKFIKTKSKTEKFPKSG